MIVYVAMVKTDSGDDYIWVYEEKPTRKQVINRLHEWGGAATKKWYDETTDVTIYAEEIIRKGNE